MLQFDGKVRLDALLRRKDHAFDRAGRRDAVANDYGRIDAEHGRTAHVLVIHRVPESVSAAEFLVDVVEALGHLQYRIAHETVADDHVCDLAREEVRRLDVTHEIDAVVGLQQLVRGLGLRIALGLRLWPLWPGNRSPP